MFLSSTSSVAVLRVVVVPSTVKLPLTVTLFENVLFPAIVCAPVVLTTVLSTAKVPDPVIGPPVRPSPLPTLVTVPDPEPTEVLPCCAAKWKGDPLVSFAPPWP